MSTIREVQQTIANALMTIANKITAAAAEPLPAVTSDDNGKALLVSGGEWGAGTLPAELPAVTSDDNGKALLVSGGAWAAGSLPAELPAVTAADVGKVLTVNAEGQWVAVLPG